MDWFFVERVEGGFCKIQGQEVTHLTKVMRKKIGEDVMCIDGEGNVIRGMLMQASRSEALIKIQDVQRIPRKRKYRIHLAIAPPKKAEKFELVLEKCTELGIEEITPIRTSRTERKNLNVERCQKILIAATKQAQEPWLPVLHPMQTWSEFLASLDKGKNWNGFIGHCNRQGLPHLAANYPKQQDVILAVGPPGDFSVGEVDEALQLGFQEMGLGNTRLRTETAGIAACHTIHVVNAMNA